MVEQANLSSGNAFVPETGGWGSNLRLVISVAVLPVTCHCFILSKGAVLSGRNDAEMGPANITPFGVIQRVFLGFDFLAERAKKYLA